MRLVLKISIFSLFLAISFSGYSQSSSSSSFYAESVPVEKLVQMYPNPATDYLTIKLQTPNAATMNLAVHSVIGNILELEREVIDDYEVRIRVKDLPSGYYFLSIKEDNSGLKASYKFLKR